MSASTLAPAVVHAIPEVDPERTIDGRLTVSACLRFVAVADTLTVPDLDPWLTSIERRDVTTEAHDGITCSACLERLCSHESGYTVDDVEGFFSCDACGAVLEPAEVGR